MRRRVAIVGGGLAGIAAAVRVTEAGWCPIVVETRKRLGGRATSFVDPRTGLRLDNCQHVLLGCCTNLIDLYDRLGVVDRIEWHKTLYWTSGHGLVDELRAGPLPAPLHLVRSFRRMKLFDRAEKRHIARGMWRLTRLGTRGRWRWRERTFADFLRESGQPPSVIDRFWNTIVVSACNLDVERVGAAHAMQVFQEGFLNNRWSYTMGVPAVPLSDLYDPAVALIEERGGAIHLGTSARAIAFDGERVTGVVTADDRIEATSVISAVPFDRLDRLVSTAMRAADPRLQSLDRIAVSPILGVHLLFTEPIMELPHLVLVGSHVQWLFNKGVDADGRQLVHAVISAADEWMDVPEEELVRVVLADVHRALPRGRGLEPVEARAVKEKRATFAATPDVDDHRPRTGPGSVGVGGGGIANLLLAGDWCDTGWPATMEGAVRSGYAAAAELTGEGGPVGDVPPGWLARLAGLG